MELTYCYLPPNLPFDTVLNDNDYLRRSFGEQLFVSLLFRDLSYVKTTRPDRFGRSSYLGLYLEMAGAELWAANAIYNEFALEPKVLQLGDNIDFSQYFKFDFDTRYYKQLKSNQVFAARLNFAIARPFGFTTDVPYVKQLYVGGPNSIRAWNPRGLGPGGFEDPLSRDQTNIARLYQTGDIKIEFNLEYRFDIFWYLKGAFFIDGGNVWTLTQDEERCGSQFLFSRRSLDFCPEDAVYPFNDPFYKQIALGGGLGFRFDFSYFIFRIDLATRLRQSFPTIDNGDPVRESDYWESFKDFKLRDIVINWGLGYPF